MRVNGLRACGAAVVLAFPSAAASDAQPRRRAGSEQVVTGAGIVPVTVGGVPGRIRIDPAGWGLPVLNADYARRARLRAGPFAFANHVGPYEVDGVTAVTRIGINSAPRKRRVGWTERPYFAGADATVGPGGVPQQVVRFALRAPLAGERTASFPLADEGGMFGGWGGMYALIQVGGAPMRVRFNPHHPETLATAGAGVRIAAAHGGGFEGATRSVAISYGLRRPVRTLRLRKPLQLGPLAIPSLGVRTADYGSVKAIGEAGGASSDPDEIVVTGTRRRETKPDRLWLGADHLARCSSIVFDKRARRVHLTCA